MCACVTDGGAPQRDTTHLERESNTLKHFRHHAHTVQFSSAQRPIQISATLRGITEPSRMLGDFVTRQLSCTTWPSKSISSVGCSPPPPPTRRRCIGFLVLTIHRTCCRRTIHLHPFNTALCQRRL